MNNTYNKTSQPCSIEEWLESLGLAQYLANFTNAGLSELQDCTSLDSDFLKDIGISLLGHRKRILEEIPLIDLQKYNEERDQAKPLSSKLDEDVIRRDLCRSVINMRTGSITSTKLRDSNLPDLTEASSPPPPPLCPGARQKIDALFSPKTEEVHAHAEEERDINVSSPEKIPAGPKKPIPAPRKTTRKKSQQEKSDLSVKRSPELTDISPSHDAKNNSSPINNDWTLESCTQLQQKTFPDSILHKKDDEHCETIYSNFQIKDFSENAGDDFSFQKVRDGNDGMENQYEAIWMEGGTQIESNASFEESSQTKDVLVTCRSPKSVTPKPNSFPLEKNDIYQNYESPESSSNYNTFPLTGSKPAQKDNITHQSSTESPRNFLETDLDENMGMSSGFDRPKEPEETNGTFKNYSRDSVEADISFELPHPNFPPPPLPQGSDTFIRSDDPNCRSLTLSMFDPLSSRSAYFPESRLPNIPPRRVPEKSTGYVNFSDNENEPNVYSFASSQDNAFTFTPDKRPWVTPNIDQEDETTLYKNSKPVIAPRTPMMKGITCMLPSMTTPGPDPFQDDDPFKEFNYECTKFNKLDSSSSVYSVQKSLSGVEEPRFENSKQSMKSNTEGTVEEPFDPFGLHGESIVYQSLLDVPPPPYVEQTGSAEDATSLTNISNSSTHDCSTSGTDSTEAEEAEEESLTCLQRAESTFSLHKKVERTGYLTKLGGVSGNQPARKRWFVFDGESLKYFNNSNSMISKRIIPVSSMEDVKNLADKTNANANKFKFSLRTKNRTFIFFSDTLDDCILWCSALLAAIMNYKNNPPSDLDKEGGEMNNPDKEGFINFQGLRKKYVALKNGKMCYYNTYEDFKIASPIHEILMKLCSVRKLDKNKLQLYTNYNHRYVMTFDKVEDAVSWEMAFESAIANALGDNTILVLVVENPANKFCADCGAPDPHWASIVLGITVCYKCAGIHRGLDLNISRIRSLRMDVKVWTPSLIEMMKLIGNENANRFWEGRINDKGFVSPDMGEKDRKNFIENKYVQKMFCDLHPLHIDKATLNEEMFEIVQTDDVLGLYKILFSGADVLAKSPKYEKNAFTIAEHCGERIQMELLYQNGGDASDIHLEEERIKKIRAGISMQGYLKKTGGDKKDFRTRWCLIEYGSLKYLSKEASSKVNGFIENEKMLCVEATPLTNHPHAFELSTSKPNNRQGGYRDYLFSASSLEEKQTWMIKISQLMCPIDLMNEIPRFKDFSLSGNFYLKETMAGTWRKTWVMICGKTLRNTDKDGALVDDIDLRKATSLQQVAMTSCDLAKDAGKCFVLSMPGGRALYFQADIEATTLRLFDAIEQEMKCGGDTLEDQCLTSDDVVVIVKKCVDFIDNYGLDEDGIYRKAGTGSRVENLLKRFQADANAVNLVCGPDGEDVHEVANALKRFLRNLKEPLMMNSMYDRWIERSRILDSAEKKAAYKVMINQMPVVHRKTLEYLVLHLNRVYEHRNRNHMSLEAIGPSFGSTLLKGEASVISSPPMASLVALEMSVITDLINFSSDLFQYPDTARRVQDGQARFNELEQLSRIKSRTRISMNDMLEEGLLLDIYIGSPEGHTHGVKIYPRTTAQDVINDLISRGKVENQKYVLHETVALGALDRPLHCYQNLQEVTNAWWKWPEKIRKNARLCLKSTENIDRIMMESSSGNSVMGEFKFINMKKNKKKAHFELRQMKISYFKNAQAFQEPIESWNIEDIAVYIGADPDIKKLSDYALTFRPKNENPGSCFGHTIFMSSQNEVYRWLCTILRGKFSGPFYE